MVAAEEATYKRISRAKDPKFSIDELDHYSLVLQVGIADLQFAVIDSQDNQCMGLEDYRFRGVKTVNTRLRLIKRILDDHEYLTAGFWKDVKLSLKTHKFSLVPNEIFAVEAAEDYLALNSEIKTSFEEVKYYKQIVVPSSNTFAAESKLCSWIESIYKKKKVHIVHQGSALIEGVMKHDEHIKKKSLYVFLDRGILHLIVTRGSDLLFYNQFSARKKEEILKYIMLVLNEMKMNPKVDQVLLWGFFKQQSEEVQLLKKYIRNISFGQKPSFLRYAYVFDEIDDHHYFDVLSGYLCD